MLDFLPAMHDFQVLGIAVNDCYARTMRLAACEELISRLAVRELEVADLETQKQEKERLKKWTTRDTTVLNVKRGQTEQLRALVAQNRDKNEQFCDELDEVKKLKLAGRILPEHTPAKQDPTNSATMIEAEPPKSIPPTVTVLYRPKISRGYRNKVRN